MEPTSSCRAHLGQDIGTTVFVVEHQVRLSMLFEIDRHCFIIDPTRCGHPRWRKHTIVRWSCFFRSLLESERVNCELELGREFQKWRLVLHVRHFHSGPLSVFEAEGIVRERHRYIRSFGMELCLLSCVYHGDRAGCLWKSVCFCLTHNDCGSLV